MSENNIKIGSKEMGGKEGRFIYCRLKKNGGRLRKR